MKNIRGHIASLYFNSYGSCLRQTEKIGPLSLVFKSEVFNLFFVLFEWIVDDKVKNLPGKREFISLRISALYFNE